MKFNLKVTVYIVASIQEGIAREYGEVIGRAEYTDAEPQYLVRYMAGDGRATEQWWAESALRAA